MGQNNSEVCAFVYYGYTPFSRVQCIKRLLFIWATAWIPCAMSGHRIAAGAVMLLCISAVTGLFLRLIRHHPTEMASRFLCDAVTYTYHALVCNVLSYQVLRRRRERVGLCSLFFCLFCSSESPAWRWRYAAASDAADTLHPLTVLCPWLYRSSAAQSVSLRQSYFSPPRIRRCCRSFFRQFCCCSHWVLASAR